MEITNEPSHDMETYYQERINMDNKFLKAYPHKFSKSLEFNQFINKYNHINDGQRLMEKEFIESLIGRIVFKRSSRKKLYFYTFHSNGQNLQIMSDLKTYHNNEEFNEIHTIIKRGDIVGITGYPCRTKKGELSIIPISIEILAPCYHIIPNEHFGVVDKEIRYGQRYLDLIINKNVRNIFVTRSKVISFLRNYLESMNFIEVETPILNNKFGGATAKPFSNLS